MAITRKEFCNSIEAYKRSQFSKHGHQMMEKMENIARHDSIGIGSSTSQGPRQTNARISLLTLGIPPFSSKFSRC